jgi:hypothetical protein
MGMTLWFAWVDGTLTKNVWQDPNVLTFAELRDAKNHILNAPPFQPDAHRKAQT